jgi:hypothetical protein
MMVLHTKEDDMQISIKDYPAKYDTTAEAIRAEFGSRIVGSFAELTAWTTKDAAFIQMTLGRRQEAAQAKTSPVRSAEPMATERQISFIRSLIRDGKHLEGGFLSLRADMDLSRLTRRQASSMIDSLTGRY